MTTDTVQHTSLKRPSTDTSAVERPPFVSTLDDRFNELSSIAPLTSFFKAFVDPVVVVATLYLLHFPFQVTFDNYSIVLAAVAFLLSVQFLDGTFLFVPGNPSPLVGLGRFIGAWSLVVLFITLLGYVTTFADYFYPPYIISWYIAAPAVMLTLHLGCRRVFLNNGTDLGQRRRAVIVGANQTGLLLANRICNDSLNRFDFVGYFDDRHLHRTPEIRREELLGRMSDLPAFVKANRIHNVYISLPMSSQPRVLAILDELQDSTVSIYFVPDLFIFDLIQARFDHVAGIPVVAICESPFVGINAMVKRLSDILLSLCILALAWPVMAAVALAVKATSPGPVLFRQRRYGADGNSITVFKFRSMTVLEDGSMIMQAKKNDGRLTPIGAFIRKTSLDELPQLFNVLSGDMSIVGPRPHANAHNELYRKIIKGYMIRHKVKPGLTGWAQVNGLRGETDSIDKMQKRIDYDLDYLRHWSLWLDIKIIFRTIAVVARDKNAY